jgi:LysM repeat protein
MRNIPKATEKTAAGGEVNSVETEDFVDSLSPVYRAALMRKAPKTTKGAKAGGKESSVEMDDFIDSLSSFDEVDPHRSSHRPQRITNTVILLGAGILFLISLFIFIYSTEKNTYKEEFAAIKARLDQVEKRSLSHQSVEERISHLEKGDERLQATLLQRHNALKEQLNDLAKEIDQLEKNTAVVAPDFPLSTIQQTSQDANKRYHVVRSGETLYQIGEIYGISLENLCSLNKLSPTQLILPGQKLLVASDR